MDVFVCTSDEMYSYFMFTLACRAARIAYVEVCKLNALQCGIVVSAVAHFC